MPKTEKADKADKDIQKPKPKLFFFIKKTEANDKESYKESFKKFIMDDYDVIKNLSFYDNGNDYITNIYFKQNINNEIFNNIVESILTFFDNKQIYCFYKQGNEKANVKYTFTNKKSIKYVYEADDWRSDSD